ncbi:RING-H2 finger protein ATL74-like [Diospyros lotus]|uniref:RING-H2 finger protein ATL74-like n=1 Tax=Diospyros lotus TaxID=55363 RepID=UPI002254DAC1|nr:RING-H2 finger protein ATL74-like [Diospyros lotus]
MIFQASPPVAAHALHHHSNSKASFNSFMNIVYYVSSAFVCVLVLGGIGFCIYCCLLYLQIASRRFAAFLWRLGFFDRALHAIEERKKKKILKSLPPLVEYLPREGAINCSACAICLEDFRDGELCQVLPLCTHAYHSACIRPWLINNQRCPTCRTPLSGKTKVVNV